MHPFYTNKGMRSSCHIQLLEKEEIISDPLKVAASAISEPLSSIVNNSFDQCKFPTKAKFAEVGPIHKKNSQLEKVIIDQ